MFEQLAGVMALKYVPRFCDHRNMHKCDFVPFHLATNGSGQWFSNGSHLAY